MEAKNLLILMVTNKFRPFDNLDWQGYAGCESKTPYIAEFETGVIIIDGDKVIYAVYEEDEQCFELSKIF